MMKVIVFFVLIVFASCQNRTVPLSSRLKIKIDSIYINEIRGVDTIRNEPFIIYYSTIKNLHDSTINIQIKDILSGYESEGNFYLINSKDTLSLYLVKNKKIKIASKSEFHVDLVTSTFNVVDLLERNGYSIENRSKDNKLTEVEFLKVIARESFILFEWRGQKIEIKGLEKVKIKYRNLNDSIIE